MAKEPNGKGKKSDGTPAPERPATPQSAKPSAPPPKAPAVKKAAKPPGAFRVSSEPLVAGAYPEDPHKYEATRAAAAAPIPEPAADLPESYGVPSLFLVARDPHWLFTYWDFDFSAIPSNAVRDGERRFYLRVLTPDGAHDQLIEINPEAANWYIQVPRAGQEYWIELGYHGAGGDWESLLVSNRATTPAAAVAEEEESVTDFATLPLHVAFDRLLAAVRGAMEEGESLVSALARLQGEGKRLVLGGKVPEWTREQRTLLATLLGEEVLDRLSMGSAEIDMLLRKRLLEKLQSESASELAVHRRLEEILGAAESSLFSGVGASWSAQPFSVAAPREFFMHVNAEVIFYGGTHPDAKVTIDGNPVELKPDGTFRYHFKFPDGAFQIPIVAISPDGVESRSAELHFQRHTSRRGDVANTPQPHYLPAEPMGRIG